MSDEATFNLLHLNGPWAGRFDKDVPEVHIWSKDQPLEKAAGWPPHCRRGNRRMVRIHVELIVRQGTERSKSAETWLFLWLYRVVLIPLTRFGVMFTLGPYAVPKTTLDEDCSKVEAKHALTGKTF